MPGRFVIDGQFASAPPRALVEPGELKAVAAFRTTAFGATGRGRRLLGPVALRGRLAAARLSAATALTAAILPALALRVAGPVAALTPVSAIAGAVPALAAVSAARMGRRLPPGRLGGFLAER